MNYAETLGVKAKAVESAIATAAPQVKNNALAAIADALLARQEEILAANAKDLEAAVQNHMTESLQDRLRLTPARISGMANAACEVFDALQWKNVVGTLSGDDTFLIVARSERDAKTICSELTRYVGQR